MFFLHLKLRFACLTGLLAGLFVSVVSAQNPLLIGSGGYAALYAGQVNPSALSFNKSNWTVHLPGAGASFQNNLISMQRVNLLSVMAGADVSIEIDNINNNRFGPAQGDVLIQEHIEQPLRLQQGAWTMPLGIYFQYQKHAFGLYSQLRQQIYWSGLSASGFKQLWEGILFEPLRDSTISNPGLRLQLDAWGEIGASYAYRFYETRTEAMSLGITAKALLGLQTLHLEMEAFDYTIRFPDTARFDRFEGQYARSLGDAGIQSGGGFALDLGFTYVKIDQQSTRRAGKNSKINCFNFAGKIRIRREVPEHLWKVGVSWLDLGLINYNAPYFVINSFANYSTRGKFFDFSQRDFDANFIGRLQANGAVAGDVSFSVGAPTALSLQFDGRIYQDFYLYAAILQRTPLFGTFKMRRTNYLAVSPRFELGWAEIGLPVTLTEYHYLNLGLSARLGPVLFGTDRFGSLFGLQRISGADAYVAVNVFDFWKL